MNLDFAKGREQSLESISGIYFWGADGDPVIGYRDMAGDVLVELKQYEQDCDKVAVIFLNTKLLTDSEYAQETRDRIMAIAVDTEMTCRKYEISVSTPGMVLHYFGNLINSGCIDPRGENAILTRSEIDTKLWRAVCVGGQVDENIQFVEESVERRKKLMAELAEDSELQEQETNI